MAFLSAFLSCILLLSLSLSSSSSSSQFADGCYTSIFAFGDSLTDTGNYLSLCLKGLQTYERFPHAGLPPYGETFFGNPTGRYSDGRLVLDFIAEHYGLPHVQPYFGGENLNLEAGVNFAVAGVPALDVDFHEERGIHFRNNISMRTQLKWFTDLLPSLCKNSSCKEIFERSLVVFGPFGGDDYGNVFFQKSVEESLEDAQSLQPLIVDAITSAIEELIELGVVNLMVPGMLADGCLAITLSFFYTSYNAHDYDPETGCLTLLNKFDENHNNLLQAALVGIRERHPHVSIVYADYYNASLQLYRSSEKFGFIKRPLKACCGGGGPYNYNSSVPCGYSPSQACVDPSSYINWDGAHLTEAAYKWISKAVLNGHFTIPRINSLCNLPYEKKAYV
ncbi:PREDICTED: GDSL esterase/lipase At1g28580-like isoform X2 [Ipomoea nil]|uniref:GDSL esterase/lipase At1g28580-like isoform X2 n=1 Tax=Ipomoea nil TaxID=35883 RepID=UPI0009013E21|nr:PREDICTED: GDSL esterase/lipase At1g28580-like isoform X2 [Ipomoea nil]